MGYMLIDQFGFSPVFEHLVRVQDVLKHYMLPPADSL